MAQSSVLQSSPVPTAFLNTGDLASLLHGTDHPLPSRFLYPESERPDLLHDQLFNGPSLPTIDLSHFDSVSERNNLAQLLGDACKQWGFFQVVNHGVPIELLTKLKEAGHELFALPSEQKERSFIGKGRGYEGNYSHFESRAPWLESLTFDPHPNLNVEDIAGKIWPEGNQEFCDNVREFEILVTDLGRKIFVLLAESLGLETNTFAQHFNENHKSAFRFNYYPTCPQPSMTFGVIGHTDPNFLTILYQDDVGGLQIRAQDDTWVPVKPQKEAFVVNLGDAFQAWTNSRYRSVEHRVVLNRMRPRLSFAMFQSPAEDVVIRAPEELVDEEHPLEYKPFTWADYAEWRKTISREGGRATFKRFAGIDPSEE